MQAKNEVPAPADPNPADPDATKSPEAIPVTPELLAALGVPADQATAESIVAAATALAEKAAGSENVAKQIEAVTAERDAAAAKLAEIENAKTMQEVDALLAEYELPADSVQPMRDLAVSNRDQAKALLAAVPKKGAKKAEDPEPKAEIPPPKPVHDPAAKTELSPAERAKAADDLIAAIRKEGRFRDYTGAREEARRQKPELFQ